MSTERWINGKSMGTDTAPQSWMVKLADGVSNTFRTKAEAFDAVAMLRDMGAGCDVWHSHTIMDADGHVTDEWAFYTSFASARA